MRKLSIITLFSLCVLPVYWLNANFPKLKFLNSKETLQTRNDTLPNGSTTKWKLIIRNETLQTGNFTYKLSNGSTKSIPPVPLPNEVISGCHIYKLPNGTSISIPLMPASDEELLGFQWRLSSGERDLFYELLTVAKTVCRRLKIDCIMNAGTLLGSYRHMDIIPWDDDMDLLIMDSDLARLSLALQSVSSRYGVQKAHRGGMMKFYNEEIGIKMQGKRKRWKWPFIDLTPLTELNATHVRNDAFKGKVFPKNVLWPVQHCHLGPLLLDAPNDVEKALNRMLRGKHIGQYKVECKCKGLNHKTGTSKFNGTMKATTKCSNLSKYFPFTRREKSSDGKMIEHLVLDKNIIYTH